MSTSTQAKSQLGKRKRDDKTLDEHATKARDDNVLPDSGPTTANPLCINAPTFPIDSAFGSDPGDAILKEPELDLLFFKQFLKAPGRKALFDYMLAELPWYRTRGMTIRTPRWTCVWGCDDTGAPLAAYKKKPRPIPVALQELKQHVEERTGATYNFILCNYYENGKDSISWHSDDESFLGPLPTIASLTLGSSRDFAMKHKTDKSAKPEKWTLDSGDMVVMRGTTQSKWLHSIPKRANAGGRINITFRKAMNVAGTNNYYRYNVGEGPVHRWRNGEMIEMP
ncbi:hypothetical protein SISSUDRAFT_1111841 [Sistotremastrum suecicum HHB10207 ss-3]|uniref:Fe2OG dioxygenase domain-containing protein n=1 Tax=Sistotremastrum suecicum HHB10207 ss-3 TaxID=1314776 RepID=A0A166IZL1_9AGAM|nr:hypothetical protein SISSUDRAFT_1111841 [Sistotremastrum suecicum HHB10207 ss-3]